MSQQVAITAAHWVYLAGVMAVVLTMVLRANVVVPSIVATFAVALVWTHSPVNALGSIFNASFVAAKELFNIFLVIALITGVAVVIAPLAGPLIDRFGARATAVGAGVALAAGYAGLATEPGRESRRRWQQQPRRTKPGRESRWRGKQ